MNGKRQLSGSFSIRLRGSQAIHAQIYDRIKTAIESGALPAGARIPAVRSLAQDLGIARGTVETAYARLAGEGYVVSSGQRGTLVSDRLNGIGRESAPDHEYRRGSQRGSDSAVVRPFQVGVPAIDAVPRKLWTRITSKALRATDYAALTDRQVAGVEALRNAISGYLRISRGVSCTADQILITTSHQGTLDLVSRVIMSDKPKVWVEDPGYWCSTDLLRFVGAQIIPVPVDEFGIRVDEGVGRAPDARAAFVTPSHQFPLGVALSGARRQRLLEWASAANAWIVEDDYDAEYQYEGKPHPALKGSDSNDRVIYCGTFSKVLFPTMRIAYVVVPKGLVGDFQKAARIFANLPSPFLQRAVAEFISQGHFARHLTKMRKLYAHRRTLAIDALERVFGREYKIDRCAGGMHLILRLGLPDGPIAEHVQKAGMSAIALSATRIEHPVGSGLLLGFTNIADVEMATRYATELRACIERAQLEPS